MVSASSVGKVGYKRFDDFNWGMNVFIRYLKGTLALENIVRYFPLVNVTEPPTISSKKLIYKKNELMSLSGMISMYYTLPNGDNIMRGFISTLEASFKKEVNIESKMYTEGGRVLTVKLFRGNIHVTAAKEIEVDRITADLLIDRINYYDSLIQEITPTCPSYIWFRDNIYCDPVTYTDGNGEEYISTVNRDLPLPPENVNPDIIEYLYYMSQEFDDYEALLTFLEGVSKDVRLIDDGMYVNISAGEFEICDLSKWFNFGWKFKIGALALLIQQDERYTVTYKPSINTNMKCVRNVMVSGEVFKVTVSTRSSSLVCHSKNAKALRKVVNDVITLAQTHRSKIEIKVLD